MTVFFFRFVPLNINFMIPGCNIGIDRFIYIYIEKIRRSLLYINKCIRRFIYIYIYNINIYVYVAKNSILTQLCFFCDTPLLKVANPYFQNPPTTEHRTAIKELFTYYVCIVKKAIHPYNLT